MFLIISQSVSLTGCLFGFVRKKTAHAGEINGEEGSQRAPLFLCGWREYKLDYTRLNSAVLLEEERERERERAAVKSG